MSSTWISSAGGPLVCAGPSAAALWRGDSSSSNNGAMSDYERACEQSDYLSVIPCGSRHVLVLGDEPLQSTFAFREGQPIILRWVSCLSMEIAVSAAARLPDELPEIEDAKAYSIDDPSLVMFDAAMTLANPLQSITLAIIPGAYMVRTERYQSVGVFEFLVHRFVSA